jgi:predicted DNA-binding protein
MNKDRSVTIRIPNELYEKLLKEAIDNSVKENRIVKISEIIRKKLEN